MKRCPLCSKEILDGAKCKYCGYTLEGTSVEEKIKTIKIQNTLANPIRKSWLTTLLLCIFFGLLGVHRFYTGNRRIAIAQLLTTGGLGLWVLIDIILILTGSYRDGLGNKLVRK
jgi:TM2 domain-containing membrane protein YozV